VFYESPERLVESLRDALEVFGDSEAAVAREMTKMHEEFARARLSELLADFEGRDAVRGEITLVIGAPAAAPAEVSPDAVRAEFERVRGEGMRRNDAVKAVAEKFGLRKNDVYKLLL
jgi:16S rRNA (cytidine1402-2'-O)-methyltransferase